MSQKCKKKSTKKPTKRTTFLKKDTIQKKRNSTHKYQQGNKGRKKNSKIGGCASMQTHNINLYIIT